jgi:hypothetical protein
MDAVDAAEKATDLMELQQGCTYAVALHGDQLDDIAMSGRDCLQIR